MTAWPKVKFGEVLSLDLDRVSVDPAKIFPMVGVLSFGRGLFDREPVENGKTSYKTFYRLKAEHMVMSQLFGWEGALALSSEQFVGKYVSPQFPTFLCDPARLDRQFLGWLIRRPSLWEDLKARAWGMGDRRRTLNPSNLLDCEIPLPPLPEQRRIVARIEELAAQIKEARDLRARINDEAGALIPAAVDHAFRRLDSHFPARPFSSFSPHVTSGPRNWAKRYDSAGVRFYRAQDIGPNGEILENAKVFINPPEGLQGRTALLQPGDIMLVITGATVGRVARFREAFEPGFVSQHVAICRLPKEEVDPDYCVWGLRGTQGQAQLLGQQYGQGKPGLNLTNIRNLSLPFPPLALQRRIVAELDAFQVQADALQKLQNETAAKLDALLPSVLDKAFKGEL